jgi:hypothetical protein
VEQTWFIDDGNDGPAEDSDGSVVMETVRRSLTDRLPALGGANLGPGIVTFAVILASVALVTCSVVWHAHVP